MSERIILGGGVEAEIRGERLRDTIKDIVTFYQGEVKVMELSDVDISHLYRVELPARRKARKEEGDV